MKHWARIAEKLGVEVEPITRRDLARLAEFDALFIRETTSIDNHTYRFARRAVQEGMPVIDDPISMIRCTNKIYLHELMTSNGIAVPPTVILGGMHDLARAADELGFPMVLKVPDSSFSRGVKKVDNAAELECARQGMVRGHRPSPRPGVHADHLRLAGRRARRQAALRLPVPDGQEALADRQARRRRQGASRAATTPSPLGEAPPAVVDIGLRAAQLIGDGLYGVDIKETADGIFVVEVNDNPNIEHGIEDAAEKDQVWVELTRWFTDRLGG